MSKSIAEMQATARPATNAGHGYELCLEQDLVREVQRLQVEKTNLEVAAKRAEAEQGSAQTQRKMAEGADPRIEEIDQRLEVIYDQMREHTGWLGLKRELAGEWHRWREAHPAREVGQDAQGRPIISDVDQEVTYGKCNALDLLERLGDFAGWWNDDPIQPGEWDYIAGRAAPGDLMGIVSAIILMQEGPGAKAAPKSPSPSSETSSDEIS